MRHLRTCIHKTASACRHSLIFPREFNALRVRVGAVNCNSSDREDEDRENPRNGTPPCQAMPRAKGKRDVTKDKAYLAMMAGDKPTEEDIKNLRYDVKKRKVPITRKEAQEKAQAGPSLNTQPPGSGFQLKRHQDAASPVKRQKAAGGLDRIAESPAMAATPPHKTPFEKQKEQRAGEAGGSQQPRQQKRLSIEKSPVLGFIGGEGQQANEARAAASAGWMAENSNDRRKSMSAAVAAKGERSSHATQAAARLSLPAGTADAAAMAAAEEAERDAEEMEEEEEKDKDENVVDEDVASQGMARRKDELMNLVSQFCQSSVLQLKRSRDPPFILSAAMSFIERAYLKTGIIMELAPDVRKEELERRGQQGDLGTEFRCQCLREIRDKLEARKAALEEEERRMEAFKANVEARKAVEKGGGGTRRGRGSVRGTEEESDEEVEDVPFEKLKETSDRLMESWRMKVRAWAGRRDGGRSWLCTL